MRLTTRFWSLAASLVMVLSVLTVAQVAAPEPAQAAPTATRPFVWTFDGQCCVTSRSFKTSRTANVWISSAAPVCWDPDYGHLTWSLTLWRKGRFGTVSKVGSYRKVVCSGRVVWVGLKPGKYEFRLTLAYPHRDEGVYRVRGGVYFDGATP